jgi:hypothetical protein
MKSVAPSTLQTYESNWKSWVEFITRWYPPVGKDYFIAELGLEQKEAVVLHFIRSLHDSGARGRTVTSKVTSVRQWFLFHGKDITAFDSQLVQQRRQASRPNNEEKKVALSGILRLRELYYSEGLDAESLVGCRISNVTHKANSKANDHCLRGNEVVLCCGQVKLRAGSAFRTFYHVQALTPQSISSLEITFLTQKSCYKSGVSVYQAPIVIERRSNDESQLLDDLVKWVVDSGITEEDEFFGRWWGKSMRCLLSKDVTHAMKELAHDLGVPEVQLSTHSFRKGFATSTYTKEGAKQRGGWSQTSSSMEIIMSNMSTLRVRLPTQTTRTRVWSCRIWDGIPWVRGGGRGACKGREYISVLLREG